MTYQYQPDSDVD